MQQRVHQTMTWMLVHGLDELKQRLIEVWQCLGQNIIDDAIDQWRKCLRLLACIRAKRGHFEHLHGHAGDNFSVLSL